MFATENWNEFAVFPYDTNGDNLTSSKEYICEMCQHLHAILTEKKFKNRY